MVPPPWPADLKCFCGFPLGLHRGQQETRQHKEGQGRQNDESFSSHAILRSGYFFLSRSFRICSAAIFLATSSASSAGAFTPGSPPAPSPFLLQMWVPPPAP